MAAIRYPKPLAPGDRIGVTAPSAGVTPSLEPRLAFVCAWLRERGYEVVLGECLKSEGIVSAPAADRAAELTQMLVNPAIDAVAPPWGGELAIEILPHLDFGAIAAAEPTWMVGYSDISTVITPLTLLTGVATLHGQNLMDTPNLLPDEVSPWLEATTTPAGATLAQHASPFHGSFRDQTRYSNQPNRTVNNLNVPGCWRLFDPLTDPPVDAADPATRTERFEAEGRLIGGCIEVLGPIAGTRFADVSTFTERYARDEGLIVYLEACEAAALDIARHLWSLRLGGWFEHANAVLIGRSEAPDSQDFSQHNAIASALGDLNIPIVLDVDFGHVYPQIVLINGARARVTIDGTNQTITQALD